MALVSGNQLTAKALKAEGVEAIFYLMGGPINDIILCCQQEGIRTIDVRHEQGAAMMAHAYSRVSGNLAFVWRHPALARSIWRPVSTMHWQTLAR
jgi:acetolactate synthase-1/2/3 large subunit